jgi:hypothetical protein
MSMPACPFSPWHPPIFLLLAIPSLRLPVVSWSPFWPSCQFSSLRDPSSRLGVTWFPTDLAFRSSVTSLGLAGGGGGDSTPRLSLRSLAGTRKESQLPYLLPTATGLDWGPRLVIFCPHLLSQISLILLQMQGPLPYCGVNKDMVG